MSPTNEGMKVEQNVPPPFRFFDGCAVNELGCLFLGTSNRTGRYWNGSLLFLSDADGIVKEENVKAGVELSTGICDVTYLGNDHVCVGMDNGAVAIWKIDDDSGFKCSSLCLNHEDIVSSISVNMDKSKIVSASHDRHIITWDFKEELNIDLNVCAHADIVQHVSFHPQNPHLFASCARDGNALLWDLRLPKPARCLDISNLHCSPTCVEWDHDGSSVIIGCESGKIITHHIAAAENSEPIKLHRRTINKMNIHPHDASKLFSISDDCSVISSDIKNQSDIKNLQHEITYTNSEHTDFVKDIAWDSNSSVFITVGWDSKIVKHTNEKLS